MTKKPEVKATHHHVTHHAATPVEPAVQKSFKVPLDLEAFETMAKSDPARVGRLLDERFSEADARELRVLLQKKTGIDIP